MGDHPAIPEERQVVSTLASAKTNLSATEPDKTARSEFITTVEFEIGETHFVKPLNVAIQVLKEHSQYLVDIVIHHMRNKNDPLVYLMAVTSELLSGAENLRVLAGWASSACLRVQELERAARKYPNKPQIIRERLVTAVESINRCKRELALYRQDVIVGADRGVMATEILIGVVITVYTGGLGLGVAKAAAVKAALTALAGGLRAASERWVYNLRDDIPVTKILADSGVACASSMLGGAWSKSFRDYLARELTRRGMTVTEKVLEKLIEETAEGLVELIAMSLSAALARERSVKGEDALKIGVGAVVEAFIGIID